LAASFFFDLISAFFEVFTSLILLRFHNKNSLGASNNKQK